MSQQASLAAASNSAAPTDPSTERALTRMEAMGKTIEKSSRSRPSTSATRQKRQNCGGKTAINAGQAAPAAVVEAAGKEGLKERRGQNQAAPR